MCAARSFASSTRLDAVTLDWTASHEVLGHNTLDDVPTHPAVPDAVRVHDDGRAEMHG